MVDAIITGLLPAVSRERLAAYRGDGDTEVEMIVNYLFNVAVSEALYSPLCCLEVSLRNSLDLSLKQHLGTPAWYDQPGLLHWDESAKIKKAKRKAMPAGVQPGTGVQPSPGKVVAELDFGFWTSLLAPDYEATLWRQNRARLLKSSFPHIPRPLRQRGTIHERYNRLRALRNRVFHHESVWNRPTLSDDHQEIIESIGWISLAMVATLRLIDRFDDTYSHARNRIHQNVKAISHSANFH